MYRINVVNCASKIKEKRKQKYTENKLFVIINTKKYNSSIFLLDNLRRLKLRTIERDKITNIFKNSYQI